MSTTTNNPNLSFKFGLQTNLKEGAPLTPGTIYVTTDERTMWVDLPVGNETKRFRLGDFISYKNRDALVSDYENWNSSTFAYIEDINTLAKYNSTEKKWVDVNNFNLIQDLDTRVGHKEIKNEEGTVTSKATGLFKKIKDEEDRATAKEGALETSIGSLADRTSALETKVGSDKDGDKEATGLYKIIADEVTRATGIENAINVEIGDKDSKSGIEATNLWAAIEEVAANAGSSETSVTALIAAEAQAREEADESLSNRIEAEAKTRKEADDALSKAIEAEAKTRKEADDALDDKIDETKESLIGGSTYTSIGTLEDALNQLIEGEIKNRTDEDTALSTRITNEVNALNNTINTTKENLIGGSEYTSIGALETVLNGLITNLNTSLTTETEERIQSDQELTRKINEEAETRKTEDENLDNKIDVTKDNLIGGSTYTSLKELEDALNTTIEELANGTEASFDSLEEILNKEIQDRKDADIVLDTRITNEVNALNNTINTTKQNLEDKINTDVANEKYEREAADEALRQNLTDYVEASFAAADAMTFKGVITTIADLPTGEAEEGKEKVLVNAGDTYKVGEIITDTPKGHDGAWYVGDLIIAKVDQRKDDSKYLGGWYHISSGFEDDYTSYFDIDEANDIIVLKNGAEQSNGQIKFEVPADGSESLTVNVSKDLDSKNRVQNSTVSINLVWGTF